MRGGRSFLILLVLALGLGGYAYFVESKRDLTDPKTVKAKVFGLEAGKIEEVKVTSASGETTTLKKSGTDWQIVAPEPMPADTAAVGSLVSSLETLEQQSVLDENPTSLDAFGLKPPKTTVAFKVAGETAERKLLLGNKTPTGSDLYAQVEGQPRVILISSYLNDTFNRTTFDLRDKTALKFDRGAVDAITIEAAGAPTTSFTRKGDQWQITAPVNARADFAAVDAIVGKVQQAQMKSIVAADGTKDLKTYGLDKPQATATFGAGSNRATLAIGAKKDDNAVYARDLSRPVVFTLEPSVLTDIKKKPEDVRLKDIFEFRTFTATGLDITHGATALTIAKEKAAPPAKDKPAEASPVPAPAPAEVWKQKKPTAKDLDQTAVNDLLNGVSTLRAESFAEKALPSGEDIVIVARFGDASAPKEERVTLRKSGGVVHAIRPGDPGAAVIAPAEFDKILGQLKAISESK
ncbi:MAG TPA: DUF4340 domain-containing protein [Vicinamibacterales bacterium]|nr:DUF4340 domain-containing protein [Vicinamibacterales bacterium]